MDTFPSYLKTHADGSLEQRTARLEEELGSCTLCPRECRVNRLEGDLGYCQAPAELVISSVFAHYGEEAPLVGSGGSGTIFLTHCNLKCLFCQNYEISMGEDGTPCSHRKLAAAMIDLQRRGCHNINFVTPTHYVPQILRSLTMAIDQGLSIPLVYNCGGYESLEVIKLLAGIIDIYMPDAKFAGEEQATAYCNAPDYPLVLREVLCEMHRQVGDLRMDDQGIVTQGLLIRHLVMPQGVAGTKEIISFIVERVSENSYVNIMAQYRPLYRSGEYPEIDRRITTQEYRDAVKIARREGLHKGF
jgi:putative pyruvate formate lyase activating enzyme